MKRLQYFFVIIFIVLVHLNLFADQEIKINFKNLDIENFIKITSKIIQKDILITSKVEGKVNYISNKSIDKKNILDVLKYDLQSKGFSLLRREDIFLVVKDENLFKYNETNDKNSLQVEVIPIKNLESKLVVKF